jgi:polysaccharide deacetylase family protein (PEP-CTERM system associated)
MTTVLNAMTVDLEDWAQAVLDPRLGVSDRVVANAERLLTFLDRQRVRATFFALGRVCEAWPRLLPMIRDAGHEIASHGYGHELVYHLNEARFAADLRESIDIIVSQTGRRPIGYRAPAFSITAQSRWAGPVLAKLGFRYSSSIFPIRGKRYGMADAPRFPHRWQDCALVEFPMTTLWFGGRAWPACGGGYTRLLPGAILAHAIRQMNSAGHPAVIYVHPYELAPGEVSSFVAAGTRVSFARRITQELWRSRVLKRLERLMGEFEFGTMSAALAACGLCSSAGEQADQADARPAQPSPRDIQPVAYDEAIPQQANRLMQSAT